PRSNASSTRRDCSTPARSSLTPPSADDLREHSRVACLAGSWPPCVGEPVPFGFPIAPRRMTATESRDVRAKRVTRDQEAAFYELVVALERAVLVLDGDDLVVADRVQSGKEALPADLAETRQPGHLPADPERQDAVAVQALAVDLHVLGVDVEDPVGVVVDDPLVVDHLPDEVRGVQVEPEA